MLETLVIFHRTKSINRPDIVSYLVFTIQNLLFTWWLWLGKKKVWRQWFCVCVCFGVSRVNRVIFLLKPSAEICRSLNHRNGSYKFHRVFSVVFIVRKSWMRAPSKNSCGKWLNRLFVCVCVIFFSFAVWLN